VDFIQMEASFFPFNAAASFVLTLFFCSSSLCQNASTLENGCSLQKTLESLHLKMHEANDQILGDSALYIYRNATKICFTVSVIFETPLGYYFADSLKSEQTIWTLIVW
jgi:hypothetical protein